MRIPSRKAEKEAGEKASLQKGDENFYLWLQHSDMQVVVYF